MDGRLQKLGDFFRGYQNLSRSNRCLPGLSAQIFYFPALSLTGLFSLHQISPELEFPLFATAPINASNRLQLELSRNLPPLHDIPLLHQTPNLGSSEPSTATFELTDGRFVRVLLD
jgi:hypothetical protein